MVASSFMILITYHISTAGEYGNLIVDMRKIEIGKNCRK